MRKIFFLTVTLLCTHWLQGQFNTVKFTPATFTAEDEITLSIDVSSVDALKGKTDLYIWIWANENAPGYTKVDGITNGGVWGNSKPEAKMTSKGNNVFEYKFLPTTMFGLEPGKLLHFQFLVKTQDGLGQSANSPNYLFEPIVFIPVPFRVFPNRLSAQDVATVYFHQDLAPTTAEQRMTPKTVTVSLFDKDNKEIGASKTWNLKSEGNKVWSYSFIPNITWSIPAGITASKFTFRFDGTGKDVNGNNVNITGTTTEKIIDALQ